MKKIINIIKTVLDKIKINHIDEYTASSAYFTILAFIPLIMLVLTLTKYVGIEQNTLFNIIERLVPSNILNDAVLGIVKEVYSKSVGTITISAIFVLWSAGKGFWALCNGLNSAYEIPESNQFMHSRIRGLICTIIFILFIVLTLVLLVFGNSINLILQEKFNVVSTLMNMILKSKILISIIILSMIFIIMYKFIPQHKTKLKYQIPGAIFAAIACNVISIFYSIYVDLFTGFSIMYGSLTTVVLAMMWVYACMYSILLGAIINNILIENFVKKSK